MKRRLVVSVSLMFALGVGALQLGVGAAAECSPIPGGQGSPSPSPSPSSSPEGLGDQLPGIGGGTGASRSSAAADSEQCPGTVSVNVTPASGTFGLTVTVSGRLLCDGVPLQQATMRLQRTLAGESRWNEILVQNANDEGEYSFTDKPPRTAQYRVSWSPDTGDGATTIDELAGVTCSPATSEVRTVTVSAGVWMWPAYNAKPRRGQTVTFGGSVAPVHAGHRVNVQALLNNKWTNVGTVTLDAKSQFRWSYRRTSPGSLLFRAAYPTQHADHAWGISKNLKISWS